MAMASNKTQCFTCNKDKITYSCEGCSKRFCFTDLAEHKQILNNELNHIINNYDEFKQRINEQKQNPQNHSLIKQINQWEINSIQKIQKKAEDCRKIVIESLRTFLYDTEKKFNNLSEQIKHIHAENEFNEINLNYLRNQLMEITQELNYPSNISIQQDSQPFINEISIISSIKSKFNKWKQNAITVAGGNRQGQGQKLNQLLTPVGIFIDKNKNIFIADSGNNRIVEWKYNAKQGQIVAGGNGEGNRVDQLNDPKDKNEVRRWKMGEYNNEGVVVAGGNGKGNQLNQLSYPTCIFVDEDQSVYISDRENHRVMKWRKDANQGRIVGGENGKGKNLNQLSYPQGIIVDHLGQIYVADCRNDRVMRWREGDKEGEIVAGGNGKGSQSNQLNLPIGLSFDNEENLYVADYSNNRIQKFEII
ncbi:unnamed protein product [Adineta steineri]|uniref:Uncharacterized protein n=1 Tax=Adineta steineri TaxID=433720 RepID=A0A815TJN4_9BILA|nr:unnamed protein product [Adineta steineri]CAF1644980.1 unnamed protein product [Adineta steineri]